MEAVFECTETHVDWLIDKLEDEIAENFADDATYARRCQEFEEIRKLGWSE